MIKGNKALVARFQAKISPFGDKELSKALTALYESGCVSDIEDSVDKLFVIVNDAVRYGAYANLYDASLMQIILDYLEEKDFIEEVAKELHKVCNVGYLGYKMDYKESVAGYDDKLFYFDKEWYHTLNTDFKAQFGKIPLKVRFFFENAEFININN